MYTGRIRSPRYRSRSRSANRPRSWPRSTSASCALSRVFAGPPNTSAERLVVGVRQAGGEGPQRTHHDGQHQHRRRRGHPPPTHREHVTRRHRREHRQEDRVPGAEVPRPVHGRGQEHRGSRERVRRRGPQPPHRHHRDDTARPRSRTPPTRRPSPPAARGAGITAGRVAPLPPRAGPHARPSDVTVPGAPRPGPARRAPAAGTRSGAAPLPVKRPHALVSACFYLDVVPTSSDWFCVLDTIPLLLCFLLNIYAFPPSWLLFNFSCWG
ncbi:predicted protein [Streptomyces viridosporus ATCC 14672]|uniref:Predicted protein n=1 Tax=Streptomyces viridosporus (strain ATCC 14672 / DSM 40746 / JCM 4963 / KCTC 9882 / NRRL B-12104 / FH 1290) TaxID=566461 RepID=D5ZYI1_STRV1|nr:predicted protein [Streptomyces viridosporus ATCC 14672]